MNENQVVNFQPESVATFTGINIIPSLVLLTLPEKVIFRKKNKHIDYDERDKLIHRRALIIGLISFVGSMFILVMAIFYVKLLRDDFSPYFLPIILLIGWAIHIITASTVTLIKYR